MLLQEIVQEKGCEVGYGDSGGGERPEARWRLLDKQTETTPLTHSGAWEVKRVFGGGDVVVAGEL